MEKTLINGVAKGPVEIPDVPQRIPTFMGSGSTRYCIRDIPCSQCDYSGTTICTNGKSSKEFYPNPACYK